MQGNFINNKGEEEEFTKEELVKLAKRIKQLRLSAGFSSYEVFALQNNISRSQWSRYELGNDMRYTSLLKITRAFNISLKDFFSEGF